MTHPKLAALFLCASLSLQACQCPCSGDDSSAAVMPDAKLEAVTIGEIHNVHELGSFLTAGQPSESDLALLKERGVSTVITLRTDPEVTQFDEAALVEELGMNFVSIPFRGPETLTDEVFGRVRDSLNNSEGPVFLHCGSANRVGGVWIAWRVLDGGLSVEDAVAEANEVGLRTAGFKDRALKYIESQQQD